MGTAAYGVAAQTAAGLAVALAGVAVFLGVAGPALYEFRRINGVRVDGLASVSERGVVRRIALTSTRKDALREHVAAPRQLIDLVD